MSIDSLIICILYNPCETEFGLELANKISNLLQSYSLKAQVTKDYSLLDTNQNIFLLDATFEAETFEEADLSFLSFPILKIFKLGQNLEKVYFYDFILYPFSDEELVSRIFNSYNFYSNIKYFQEVNDNFKSYLLNLSHDVYSPIKLIKSQMDYLRTNIDNIGEYHNEIFDSAISQLDNISDILLSVPYSPTASDNVAIKEKLQNVIFSSLLNNTAKQLSLYASNQGVEIEVNIYNSAKNTVICTSYSYLWRMVYNLLINAIKYCLGGGTVKTSLLTFDNTLRWEVSDTGIGMSPQQLEDIQQYLSYYKMNEETSKTDGGFGRGLLVVKLVAITLNATVKVESELGAGTTFTIDFLVGDI